MNKMRFSLLMGMITLLMLFVTEVTFAQNCVCAYCNVPCSSPASAHTNPNCPVYKNRMAGQHSTSGSVGIEQVIMQQIYSNIISGLFSSSSATQASEQEKARMEQERQIQQQRMAEMLKRQKAYNDSLAQAKHDKMMKDFKKLEGSGDLSYKSLDVNSWKPSVHFNCKITSFKGNVSVVKTNGKMLTLSESQSVDLAPGDWIATGNNSNIKLHFNFEGGGEDMLLGQNSVINIITNEAGTHVPKLLRGNLYITNNLLTENIAEMQEKIIYETTKEINKLKKKFEVRTPGTALAIRGTEFSVNVDSLGETEVHVISGIVDAMGILMEGNITLTAGYKGIIKNSGEIIGPAKFDVNEMKYWWKE